MATVNEAKTASGKGRKVTGWVIVGLVTLFNAFDGITKIVKLPAVVAAAAKQGFSASELVTVGVILLVCTVIYLTPRTLGLGALLLTAYYGGAVEANMHGGSPLGLTLFPVIFGVLMWAGAMLRRPGLEAVLPGRS